MTNKNRNTNSRSVLNAATVIAVVALHASVAIALVKMDAPKQIQKPEKPQPIEIELVTPIAEAAPQAAEPKPQEAVEPAPKKSEPKPKPKVAPAPKSHKQAPTPEPIKPEPEKVEPQKEPPKKVEQPPKQNVVPKKPDPVITNKQENKQEQWQVEQQRKQQEQLEREAQAAKQKAEQAAREAQQKAAQEKAAQQAREAQQRAEQAAKEEAARRAKEAERAAQEQAEREAKAAAASNTPQNFSASQASWRRKPNFQFPERVRRNALPGDVFSVSLRLEVDKQGNVVKVVVASSSGNRLIDRAAVDSVKRAKFNPFTKNGEPVMGIIVMLFDYEVS